MNLLRTSVNARSHELIWIKAKTHHTDHTVAVPNGIASVEFRYHCNSAAADLAAIEHAIAELDPAALLDADEPAGVIRVSTTLDQHDLIDCLRRAGVEVGISDLERLPSVCCGGCGG